MTADGPDVPRGIDVVARDLLRRHVLERADQQPGAGAPVNGRLSAQVLRRSNALASPKSSTLGTTPLAWRCRKMFSGFRSRWTRPWSCAALSAEHTPRRISSASPRSAAVRRRAADAASRPRAVPSPGTAGGRGRRRSRTRGPRADARSRRPLAPPRRNREWRSSGPAMSSLISFTATGRSSTLSSADTRRPCRRVPGGVRGDIVRSTAVNRCRVRAARDRAGTRRRSRRSIGRIARTRAGRVALAVTERSSSRPTAWAIVPSRSRSSWCMAPLTAGTEHQQRGRPAPVAPAPRSAPAARCAVLDSSARSSPRQLVPHPRGVAERERERLAQHGQHADDRQRRRQAASARSPPTVPTRRANVGSAGHVPRTSTNSGCSASSICCITDGAIASKLEARADLIRDAARAAAARRSVRGRTGGRRSRASARAAAAHHQQRRADAS